jgi:hypothetical protein
MKKIFTRILVIALPVFLLGIPTSYSLCDAADTDRIQQDLKKLQQQVQDLREELEQTKKQQSEKGQGQDIKQDVSKSHDGVKIGGALRFNYAYKDFSDSSEDKYGDMVFDIFRLNVDGQYDNVLISAEYRWYGYMDVIHHGWVGYQFNENWQGQLGITRVPFGLLPYASHNWWFAIPYYIGFEDDYDLGAKTIWDRDDWNLQLAFFKNAEWGSPSTSNRYSFDVVTGGSQQNEETNQFNARLAYVFDHGALGKSEVGVSGQYGQLYNATTTDTGDMWAAAVHLNGNYGPFNVMLEALSYKYNPKNPVGVSDDTIQLGAFGGTSLVASEAQIYLAGLSYDVPVSWGPVSKLTFYDDYSIMTKEPAGFPDSQINTIGCLVSAGPLYVYVDYIMGKNAQYLGGGTNPWAEASNPEGDWNDRFNINVGYYF